MRYTNVKFTWIGDYDTQRWSEDKRHNLLVELCKLTKQQPLLTVMTAAQCITVKSYKYIITDGAVCLTQRYATQSMQSASAAAAAAASMSPNVSSMVPFGRSNMKALACGNTT